MSTISDIDIDIDIEVGGIIVQMQSLNKCCICHEDEFTSNIIISCTYCTDGQLCQVCKESCDNHRKLDKCPVCRSGGDWYKTIREYNNSAEQGQEAEDRQGQQGQGQQGQGQQGEEDIVITSVCQRKMYNIMSSTLSNVLHIMLWGVGVFGAGIIGRLIVGDQLFIHAKVFWLEIILTMIVGLLVLIIGAIIFIALVSIATVCIASNYMRD
jgi:hypothetical protein